MNLNFRTFKPWFQMGVISLGCVGASAQVTPTINWTTPPPITYGVRLLGTNEFNATASYAGTNVPGTFFYSPPHGTILYSGTNTLYAVFTPADTTDYTTASNTVSLVVNPASLTVAGTNVAIVYGQTNPLITGAITGLVNGDATNISAAFSCAATNGSPTGNYPIVPTLIDPNNLETNYTVSLVNGSLMILPPAVTVTWTNPPTISYPTALGTNQLNATATVLGAFVYTPAANTVLNAGTNLLTVVFTPNDTNDYGPATNTVSLVVLPVALKVAANNAVRGVGMTNPIFTGTILGLTNGDVITATYSCSATTNSPAGNYPIVPSVQDTNNRLVDYTLTVSNGILTITNSAPFIYSAPTNVSQAVSKTAVFRVQAAGSSPLSYQWNFNGTNLTENTQVTGSKSNVLTLANIGPTNNGMYQVTITNLYGSTSASATLVVLLIGNWTALTHLAPNYIGTMMLLPDGSVMAQAGGVSTAWYRLVPGINGAYTNGTWVSDIPSMNSDRLYYSSEVLIDGRVLVAGGEYGLGTTNAEIYDPAAKTWTLIPIPPGLITTNTTATDGNENNAGFMDSPSVLLSNGKVLISPVYPASYGNTLIYDPISNSWATATLVRGDDEDEASLVMLPDNSVLVVDNGTQRSERYLPSLNQWTNDATVPVQLFDSYGDEMGAGFLLPNGKAMYIGSSSHYAIYTPSGSNAAGSWVGTTLPASLGAPDAPAAMMANGNILCALSPSPTSSSSIFTTPTYFYEYNYSNGALGTFTQTSAPGGATSLNSVTYVGRMLDLPDGTVLFSSGETSQLYVYTPYGSPLASGQPVINTISPNVDGSFHLAGTGLNGISQGAAYGDDAQMNSNYPLIRMTNQSNGLVYYARTYKWSSTSVMTRTNLVTTEFALPTNAPVGTYSLVVVANGIPSAPVSFPLYRFSYTTNAGALTITGFSGPGVSIAIPASINGLPVTAIANNAFANNSLLTNITIPASVAVLGTSAFNNCSALTSVYFEGNPPMADATVFGSDSAQGYYLSGSSGWSAFTAATGLPVAQWDPLGATGGVSFGMQSNQFMFNFHGPAGLTILVEAATNFMGPAWVPLQTNITTGGNFYFSETLRSNSPARLYRITSP